MDINYINKLLAEGNTVKQVREIIGLSEKKFQKEMKELGYKFEQKTKQYICSTSYPSITTVTTPNTIFEDDIIKNNLLKIADNSDRILEVLHWFDNREQENAPIIEVIQEGINIDLPSDDVFRITIKVNKEIWNDFKGFCDKNKQYKQQDLLSMALKNFINKY